MNKGEGGFFAKFCKSVWSNICPKWWRQNLQEKRHTWLDCDNYVTINTWKHKPCPGYLRQLLSALFFTHSSQGANHVASLFICLVGVKNDVVRRSNRDDSVMLQGPFERLSALCFGLVAHSLAALALVASPQQQPAALVKPHIYQLASGASAG